jgi:hypothetical protein
MSSLTRALFVAISVATVAPIAGQVPGPSITLTVTGPATVKAGSSVIRIEVVLTNKSDRVVTVPVSSPHELDFGFEIRDPSGDGAGKTLYYRFVTNDHTGKDAVEPPPDLTEAGMSVELGVGEVLPGKTVVYSIGIGRLFDFTQPGKYAIQVQQGDPLSGVTVKSNIVTLKVEK